MAEGELQPAVQKAKSDPTRMIDRFMRDERGARPYRSIDVTWNGLRRCLVDQVER
jgi:hypothetical protein